MNVKKRIIDAITLHTDRPTKVSFSDLYTWVVWQFPRKKGVGLCGAVRPSIPGHHWFPAIIRADQGSILIHGHLEEQFETPEAAAEWMYSEG